VKVLVTGGAGFIGSHTVDLLIMEGYEVIIVDNLKTGKIINKKAGFYQMDICSKDLEQVFEKERPEAVVHLAAQISVQDSQADPHTDAQINILGTINVLDNCSKHKVRKIVFSSSAAVYGKPEYLVLDEKHNTVPLAFYGLSKLTAEYYLKMFAELFGLRYTILRYSNVYGINQKLSGEGGVVAIFIDNLLNNKAPTIFGTGEQTRDFIYVSDVAKANLCALSTGDYEIFNISTKTAITINDLLAIIRSIMKKDLTCLYGPKKEGDILHSVLNNSKAKELLKWEPAYSITEGLEEIVENL